MRALLVLLELLARLSAIAALLAIPRDPHVAALIAFGSAALGFARAFARGEARSRELEISWRELIYGIRGRDARDLSAMREDEEGVAMLSDAAREVALVRSTTIPDLFAEGLALIALTVLAASRVDPLWIVAAACGAVPIALAVRVLQRRQFAALQRAYRVHGGLTRDTRALALAGPELRAHDCEASFASGMIEGAARMAREERTAQRFSAVVGGAPIALALIALALPTGFGSAVIQRTGLIDLGVVGGAILATGLSFVRSIEGVRRSAPYRAALARISKGGASKRDADAASKAADLDVHEIRFDALSVVHPGADHATPSELSAALASGGMALVGVNGSGKSTAVAALLGLVTKTSGRVLVDGKELTATRSAALNRVVSYLPQAPFISPGDSLTWHASLLQIDTTELNRWLERFGLTATLRSRAGAHGVSVLDLKMGSLSGGEQQRFFLARTFARPGKLLILDEPEAGLDQEARSKLGQLLSQEANERLVLVIAHDASFLPTSFQRVDCASGKLLTTEPIGSREAQKSSGVGLSSRAPDP